MMALVIGVAATVALVLVAVVLAAWPQQGEGKREGTHR